MEMKMLQENAIILCENVHKTRHQWTGWGDNKSDEAWQRPQASFLSYGTGRGAENAGRLTTYLRERQMFIQCNWKQLTQLTQQKSYDEA